jgi:hypothetical protein
MVGGMHVKVGNNTADPHFRQKFGNTLSNGRSFHPRPFLCVRRKRSTRNRPTSISDCKYRRMPLILPSLQESKLSFRMFPAPPVPCSCNCGAPNNNEHNFLWGNCNGPSINMKLGYSRLGIAYRAYDVEAGAV